MVLEEEAKVIEEAVPDIGHQPTKLFQVVLCSMGQAHGSHLTAGELHQLVIECLV